MRPYRGITKEGKWVHGWYFKSGKDSYIINVDGFSYLRGEPINPMSPISTRPLMPSIVLDAHFQEVIPETVGQSTGLNDRNGKKSFKADLIKHRDRNAGRPIEIIWQDGGWYGQYVNSNFTFILNGNEMANAEIIGNRHQNPKLLENSNEADTD
jgi:hypothetical protein